MSKMILRIPKAVIPGAVTSLNMFFGFLAIYFSLSGRFVSAAWLIVLAACMDGLDGKIARVLKASSKFGMELDSLADIVSFGMAPAILILSLKAGGTWQLVLVSFVFLLAGACRLARYNSQKKGSDKKGFSGMPIPAAAISVASFVIFSEYIWSGMRNLPFFYGLIILVSLLMVSVIPYDSFPNFTERTVKSNILLGLFILSLVLLARFPQTFCFLFMMGYTAFGITRWFFLKVIKPQEHGEDEEDEP